MTLKEYVDRCHKSFLAMERTEMVAHKESRIVSFGEFIIRCLANPESVGSSEVIDAIMKNRGEQIRTVSTLKEELGNVADW